MTSPLPQPGLTAHWQSHVQPASRFCLLVCKQLLPELHVTCQGLSICLLVGRVGLHHLQGRSASTRQHSIQWQWVCGHLAATTAVVNQPAADAGVSHGRGAITGLCISILHMGAVTRPLPAARETWATTDTLGVAAIPLSRWPMPMCVQVTWARSQLEVHCCSLPLAASPPPALASHPTHLLRNGWLVLLHVLPHRHLAVHRCCLQGRTQSR